MDRVVVRERFIFRLKPSVSPSGQNVFYWRQTYEVLLAGLNLPFQGRSFHFQMISFITSDVPPPMGIRRISR